MRHSSNRVLTRPLYTLVPDTTTPDPDDLRADVKVRLTDSIPALDAKGAPYTAQFELATLPLAADETHYLQLFVYEGTEVTDDSEILAFTVTGFTLDSLKRVQHVCVEPGRSGAAGTTDPLLAGQWHLNNTAQTAYADAGGVAGEDLGMTEVLASGSNGDGVKVAVVDTGLEICHPDLRDSVEHGASFNFNAEAALADPDTSWLVRMDVSDPFNFESTGGHGNSVAGLIAAAADNGIGGRGIAPEVHLRGYNGLNAERQFSGLINSLGASTFFPDSSDAHVFNMSFGSAAPEPSNGDDFGNLPYLVVVGAFNADGVKSSYSSAGANVWISAPGGEYGDAKPSLLTVDQMGWDRGIGVLLTDNPLDDESTVNPDGDYTAGYGYHNWYGFGAVDIDAAVELAEGYTPDSLGEFRETSWFEQRTSIAIPDNNGTGITPRSAGGC